MGEYYNVEVKDSNTQTELNMKHFQVAEEFMQLQDSVQKESDEPMEDDEPISTQCDMCEQVGDEVCDNTNGAEEAEGLAEQKLCPGGHALEKFEILPRQSGRLHCDICEVSLMAPNSTYACAD